jgi:Na+/H+ antiporter NhaA
VPLFVADLAFPSGRFESAVKLGLLLASVLAGAGGTLVLLVGGSKRRARRP